jgi:hypothetical protein
MKDEYSFPRFYKYKAFRAIISNKPPTIKISSPINLKAIYLIKRHKGLNETKLIKYKMKHLVEILHYNNLIDWEYGYMPFITGIRNSYFNRFVNSYLYINQNSKLSNHWHNFKEVITEEAKNWERYEFIMPEKYSNTYAIDLMRFMRTKSE